MKVLLINDKNKFFEVKGSPHVEVNGVHVGYGTLEPKRLEAKDAIVTFLVEEKEFNDIMDFILDGVSKVEVQLTDKHKIIGDAQLFMNIGKHKDITQFKIQMTVK